ncbi:MAG: ATP synthase subunit I [bacterium]
MEISTIQPYAILGSALIGGGVGALFFLGLKYTLDKLPTSKRPGLLSMLSFFSRTAFAAGGAAASGFIGGFGGLIAFTSGFILAKAVILGVARSKKGRTG